MATEKRTFSVSMSPSLLDKVDAECSELGLTRSAFFALLSSSYFRGIEATQALANTSQITELIKQQQQREQISLWALESAKNDI